MRIALKLLASSVLFGALSTSAFAQALAPAAGPPSPSIMSTQRAPTDLERATAKPMLMLGRGPDASATAAATSAPLAGVPVITGGGRGGLGITERPSGVVAPKAGAQDASIQNYGSSGAAAIWQYNDRYVNAYTTYPYSTYGKIYFKQTASGGWYICSGAMIAKSIVVTAGHCVHRGNGNSARGNGYNYTTYFIPAVNEQYNPDYMPFGYAYEVNMITTSSWYYGNGALGRGGDIGLIALHKRRLSNGSLTNTELGTYTGWNSYCLSNCLQSYWFLSQYGYPGNYYSAQIMTESQHLASTGSRWASWASGDYVAGSGMEGGSSGGPSVANPGYISDSAAYKGNWATRNVIFATTSWGYPGANLKVQGYSTLSGPNNSNNFRGLYNVMCNTARAWHGTASCSLL